MDNQNRQGTPKDFRGAIENALDELRKPGGDDPNATKKNDPAETIYNHVMDRLRHDFSVAILNRETAEQLFERIKNREFLDAEGPIMY